MVAAKDIPDEKMCQAIWLYCQVFNRLSISRLVLNDLFPAYPPKVVLAKVRKLTLKGLVDGCACGCSGNFSLKPEGNKFIFETGIHE